VGREGEDGQCGGTSGFGSREAAERRRETYADISVKWRGAGAGERVWGEGEDVRCGGTSGFGSGEAAARRGERRETACGAESGFGSREAEEMRKGQRTCRAAEEPVDSVLAAHAACNCRNRGRKRGAVIFIARSSLLPDAVGQRWGRALFAPSLSTSTQVFAPVYPKQVTQYTSTHSGHLPS